MWIEKIAKNKMQQLKLFNEYLKMYNKKVKNIRDSQPGYFVIVEDISTGAVKFVSFADFDFVGLHNSVDDISYFCYHWSNFLYSKLNTQMDKDLYKANAKEVFKDCYNLNSLVNKLKDKGIDLEI